MQGKGIIRGAQHLYQQYSRSFAGMSKRKPVAKDLEKYDVIVVGANLGGIWGRHFDDATKGKYTLMDVFDSNTNEASPMRTVYEQSRVTKTEYLPNAKLAINMYTAHSDCIGVDKFLPEENQVVLRNGRKIGYEQLVIAMGLKEDVHSIKGLYEAWGDHTHPVYVSRDHPTWRSNDHKYQKYHYNHTCGDAFFCIPPYPYRGEVGGFNFFLSAQIWKWYSLHGKLSPLSSFTIMNSNDSFCTYFDEADRFIKERAKEMGINVEYGWKLVEVNKQTNLATFENVKTGQRQERQYGNLYALPPCVPHQNLIDAGLTDPNQYNLLNVHRETLRHVKYPNIFGLGDCANTPTTKSFWGGFHQVHVVRNNVARALQGQPLNALYDGYSKNALLIGQDRLTYVVQLYDQKPGPMNLLDKSGGIISKFRYLYWAKSQKKEFLNYYLRKTWGPPTHKFMKKFKELTPEKEAEVNPPNARLTPVKKEAAPAH
jgi:sulfide:quinone oxidoreductase